MTHLPVEPPLPSISARTRSFTIAGLICLLVLSGILTFTWPDSWPVHAPIAAFFGPLLAMRMGLADGVIAFVLVVSLALPCAFRTNWFTVLLLVLAIVAWCFTGIMAGQWLWA